MRAPTETYEQLSEEDTLDLAERRVETTTIPVSAETAYELFARFIMHRDSQRFLHGEVVPNSDALCSVTWVAEDGVSGCSTFVPLGDRACLMTCELTSSAGQDADIVSRLVTDFREFVVGVSFPF
jgi:hypothetical protein